MYDELLQTLVQLAETKSLPNISLLTCDLHILPDFLGNRSPFADPSLRGMVSHVPSYLSNGWGNWENTFMLKLSTPNINLHIFFQFPILCDSIVSIC